MSDINLSRYSIGVRWIHSMTGPPLENRFINVIGGRIESFTEQPTQPEVFDFGDECQILPGTVNAHAHLELSQVPGMLDVPKVNGRRPMADWVAELMRFRRGPVYDAAQGIWSAMIREEILSETSVVFDIVPPNLDFETSKLPRFPAWLRFVELIDWRGNHRTDVRGSLSGAYGLSPHAPQTVCPALLEAVVKMDVPMAMHLAETPEEIEFLATGGGPLTELMRKADPEYDPQKVRLGKRPMDYLKLLSEAPKTLVIHGNYLDDEELKFLAERRETMAVAYCPRCHDYFGHNVSGEYPLRKMLDLGVRVLLGTDSLASAPDLSIIAEMKYLLQHHPEIPAETVFRMGTIDGAAFFGLKDGLGTLQVDGPARFAFF